MLRTIRTCWHWDAKRSTGLRRISPTAAASTPTIGRIERGEGNAGVKAPFDLARELGVETRRAV
jgi:hypothetical protein